MLDLFVVWAVIHALNTSTSSGMIPDERRANGYINVKGRVEGLKVFIDGSFAGNTPLENFALTSGFHRIVVKNPHLYLWNAEDWVKDIYVVADSILSFEIDFKKHHLINSTPYSSSVYLNGRMVGLTPLYLNLKKGDKIKVKKGGYIEREITADSILGKSLVDLKLLTEMDNRFVSGKIGVVGKGKNKYITYSSLLFTAFTGFSSAYFKIKADNAYSNYKRSITPWSISEYFNRTKKYDRYSLTAFVLFEGGFIFSMLWLLI
ncbi:MAG: PEGA domain-containing protein [Fidelibacterota bacterium]